MKRTLVISISALLFLLAGCSKDDNADSYTGVIEGTIITISSPISDKLVDLAVDEGQAVSAGEFLGLIDTTQLSLQKQQLEYTLDEVVLQKKSTHLKIEQVEDAYNHAHSTLLRNQKLLARNAVPDQKVRDIKLENDRLEKELRNVRINSTILDKKEAGLKAQLKLVRNNIDKAVLQSPIKGYVQKTYIDEGEYSAPMAPLMDIINLNDVWCYIYVAENRLHDIQMGDAATAHIDGSTQTYNGKVSFISSNAEFTPKEVLTPENRSALVFAVKVELNNSDGRLKSGMPVEIHLQPKGSNNE